MPSLAMQRLNIGVYFLFFYTLKEASESCVHLNRIVQVLMSTNGLFAELLSFCILQVDGLAEGAVVEYHELVACSVTMKAMSGWILGVDKFSHRLIPSWA